MLEVFEKHLKEAQKNTSVEKFKREIEQTNTLEDQVKLCERFIKDNRPPLPKPDFDPSSFSTVKTEVPDTIMFNGKPIQWLRVKHTVNALDQACLGRPDMEAEIKSNMVKELAMHILKSDAITWHEQLNYASVDKVYYAEVGVVKR